MSERSPENLQSTGIQLVSREEDVKLLPYTFGKDFNTKKVAIPSLGMVQLVGMGQWLYDDEEMGMAAINDRLVIDKAKSFKEKGLFEIEIRINGIQGIGVPLACRVLLPTGTILEAEFDFYKDEVAADPYERYYALSSRWKVANDKNSYLFFAPARAELLSQLRFSFKSLPQASTLPK